MYEMYGYDEDRRFVLHCCAQTWEEMQQIRRDHAEVYFCVWDCGTQIINDSEGE